MGFGVEGGGEPLPGEQEMLRAAQVEAAMSTPPAIAEPACAPWSLVRVKLAEVAQERDPGREVERWRELVAGRPLAWWLMWHTVHRPGLAAAERDGYTLHGHEVAAHVAALAAENGGHAYADSFQRWIRYTFPNGTIYAFERAEPEGGVWSAARDAWRQLDIVPVFPLDPDSVMRLRGPVATTEERVHETCPRHQLSIVLCGCPSSAERSGVADADLPF